MNRNQMIQLAIVLLCAALVGIWFTKAINPQPQTRAGIAVVNLEQRQTQVSASIETENPEKTQDINTSLARDPFALPATVEEAIRRRELAEKERLERERQTKTTQPPEAEMSPPPLQLQGVFWGIPRPQAIINRQILSVGDTIEGAQLVSVSKEGVTVSFNDHLFQIKLPTLESHKGSQGQ